MVKDAQNLKHFVTDRLDLDNAPLGSEYYYMSLPICVVDAVYSISIRYSMTQKVVVNFCEKYQLPRLRDHGAGHPPTSDQISVTDCLEKLKGLNALELAESVFGSKHRTSSRNGILKSEAVVEFLKVLRDYEIEYFQDLTPVKEGRIKGPIQSIRGQKSGISFKYFLMLAGRDNYLKPDRMIQRFVSAGIGRPAGVEEVETLLRAAHRELAQGRPSLSLRGLDHAIWNYQRVLPTQGAASGPLQGGFEDALQKGHGKARSQLAGILE